MLPSRRCYKYELLGRSDVRPAAPTHVCRERGHTARHPPAPRPRHRGAKAPAQRYIRVGCFYKMRNMVEWMEKRTGDRTGDGTEKKPLWCAGCVWGGQAGLGIAAPAFPRVKGCVPHASPPQSQRSLPAAAWIGEKGGPSPARSPVHPRVYRVTAAVPTPRIPPRKRMQSGRTVQRAVSPLGGTIQRPHTEAFPLCTLPGLTTWRDPSRPLRSPAGGGGRPPARCCSCRSDRALARLRRHRHRGYGQRRDLARAPRRCPGS